MKQMSVRARRFSRAWKFLRDESGAAMIEYAILIGIITVGVITAIVFVGGWVGDQWAALEADLTGEGAGGAGSGT